MRAFPASRSANGTGSSNSLSSSNEALRTAGPLTCPAPSGRGHHHRRHGISGARFGNPRGIRLRGAAGRIRATSSMSRTARTDVNEAQWLQQLHQHGGSFRPRDGVFRLRAYVCHRERLVDYAATHEVGGETCASLRPPQSVQKLMLTPYSGPKLDQRMKLPSSEEFSSCL